jgi:hypothetical protein
MNRVEGVARPDLVASKGVVELIEEIELCVVGLGELSSEQKQVVESSTGYSINALAHLLTKAANRIITLTASLEADEPTTSNQRLSMLWRML